MVSKLHPTAQHIILLHYSEIGLKGANRKTFENQLAKNIRRSLQGLIDARINQVYGRFIISLPKEFDWQMISQRLKKVVGLAHFALAVQVEQDIEKITRVACEVMRPIRFDSFRVTARRIQKNFPIKSDKIAATVGAAIQAESRARVDLTHPEAVCYIDIVENVALVYAKKIPGVRGLPVGSSEKAVSLLSSGIDSPVASWKIITRGVKLIFVHFHSAPYTSPASINNTKRLVKVLTEYQLSSKLYCIPFLEVQQAIMVNVDPAYRVVLYRRSMLRMAERVAHREKAKALITGESIGQVASQTLTNMQVISEAASLPILRPLSGSDKEEIIRTARHIGTFDISIEPYEDCCSLFVPEHPVTRANMEIVHNAEQNIRLFPLEEQAVKSAEIFRFAFPEKGIS